MRGGWAFAILESREELGTPSWPPLASGQCPLSTYMLPALLVRGWWNLSSGCPLGKCSEAFPRHGLDSSLWTTSRAKATPPASYQPDAVILVLNMPQGNQAQESLTSEPPSPDDGSLPIWCRCTLRGEWPQGWIREPKSSFIQQIFAEHYYMLVILHCPQGT